MNKKLLFAGTATLAAFLATVYAVISQHRFQPASDQQLNYSPLRFLSNNSTDPQAQEVELSFIKFTTRYHRSYLTKAEYTARLAAFRANYEVVKAHNSDKN